VRWLRQVTPYVHAFAGDLRRRFGGEMFAERARLRASSRREPARRPRIRLCCARRPPQIEAELKARARWRYAQG